MTFPSQQRVNDFWRVNSYGYPSPFGGGDKALNAWTTLQTFFEYSDYQALKAYWASKAAPWELSSHAVESWKATFEEFGLLWVESRSNYISITPAGAQLMDAAQKDDQQEFAWIGLNLLLRYPLRGPRRPKSQAHENSDLLLYRFWYAAILDLEGFLRWTEIERILCRVFSTNQAIAAIDDIRQLRGNPKLIGLISLPASRQGAFYNSLNQVAVHAGMNHLLMDSCDERSPYGVTEPPRVQRLRLEWSEMVRKALLADGGDLCGGGGAAVSQLPTAPELGSEGEYFEYLGARVKALASFIPASLSTIDMNGEVVWLLEEGLNYTRLDGGIVGPTQALCQLGLGHRVILSSDHNWTYLVERKQLKLNDHVVVYLRRARPITNIAVIQRLKE